MRRFAALALSVLTGFYLMTAGAIAGPAVTPLVTTNWLAQNTIAEGLVVLDIRSVADCEAGHIPGALQTDYTGNWRTTRDEVPWVLPDIADLEAFLSSLGIGAGISVVVVPAGTGSTELGGATWIYWVLKYLGHDSVAILDGGWAAWAADGLPTETGPTSAHLRRPFVAAPRAEILASTNYVAERLFTQVVIIDARPPGQYEGTTQSGLVTRPGHIPGAISLDNALFYDTAANRLKTIDELTEQLPLNLSVFGTQIIVYCNTGHWSSINWFVLHELLGFDNARLYEGSMAAWSRDLALPLITGPDP